MTKHRGWEGEMKIYYFKELILFFKAVSYNLNVDYDKLKI